MHRQTYQKVTFHLSILGIAFSILVGFSDVIFEHSIELFHILFEVIESGLDHFIEHVFETELRETQVIVFYVLLVLGGGSFYFVWKVLVRMVSGAELFMSNEWTELKDAVIEDWEELTIEKRIILISALLLFVYLASFLLF